MVRPCILFVLFIISGSALQAQTSLPFCTPSTESKKVVVYQYPQPGEQNVLPSTTIIIRPYSDIIHSHSPSDFSFEVSGSQSGDHNGKISICDDNETVIFVPENPFTTGERVSVSFSILGRDPLPPINYFFVITSLSAEVQEYWRKYFEIQFESVNAAFRDQTAQAQAHNTGIPLDTLPWYFPKLQLDLSSAGVSSGNIFLTPMGSTITTEFAFITIVDNYAKPLYWREINGKSGGTADFKVLPNNNLVFPIAIRGSGGSFGEGVFYEMDSHFQIIDSFKMGNGIVPDIHDFELLPNGHTLFEAYVPVKVGPLIVADNVIQEVDQKSKQVVFEWRALSHFQLSDTYEDTTTPTAIDFAHLNSIQTDTDGNIIASFRNLDEVAKIDRQTGEIMWHWGGKHNQFTFLGDTLKFSHQHHARRIPNGHITMFDNGNNHSVYFQGNPITAPSSRAIEYDLDEIHQTANAVWQYKNIPFSNAAGSVQRLPTGNTLIGLGNLSSPAVIEVNPKNDVVFQLSLPQQTVSYRAYKYDWQSAAVAASSASENAFELQSIYPNPAVNVATISFRTYSPGIVKVEVIDVFGNSHCPSKQYISDKVIHTFNLDLRNLNTGVYYCKLSQNGNSILKTIVVQK